MKLELHQKIEQADGQQLQVLYDLVNSYLTGHENEDWNNIPAQQQEAILKSSLEAAQRLGKPLGDVLQRLKGKHGING
ncbi:hypothetical protein [Mucilaginibacter sp.]